MQSTRIAGLISTDPSSTYFRRFQKDWKLLKPKLMVLKEAYWETCHLFFIRGGVAIPNHFTSVLPAATSLHLFDVTHTSVEIP